MRENRPFSIDLEEMIGYAKSLPTWEDARPIANYLNWQFRNSGTPEVFARIDSISRHFKEQGEEAIAERVRRQLEMRFQKMLGLPEINLSDEQAVTALMEVMPLISFDNQWVAIYRILVDYCKFPSEIQAFCHHIDNCLAGRRLSRPCRYQNIQKYLTGILAKPYKQWLAYEGHQDTGFNRQKRVADKFLAIVRRIAENTENISSAYSFT
ncbi:MAG: hypothetical protein IJ067_01180 [Prevotella sp.]|nr:hypothetical protein [Prevotella sp.]